jgi:Amt family ammonium transporter
VWGGGWLADHGVLDWAGGVPVEMCSGFSALAAAIVVGSRKDYGRQALLPHNVPFVLLGAGLLWFGWFGFNGGSALAANELAGLAFTNTFLAPMATMVVWTLLDYFRTGRATAVGGATAIVVGLVAITPAAGFVSPMGALALGAIAAFPSYFAIVWRSSTRLDDSLDVFAGHGIGGMTGALLTGVFALKAWNSAGADGLLAGNPAQLGIQALGVATSLVYAGVMTFVILKLLGLVTALRAAPRTEGLGMDVSQHGEEAYSSGEGSILDMPDAIPAVAPATSLEPQTAAR